MWFIYSQTPASLKRLSGFVILHNQIPFNYFSQYLFTISCLCLVSLVIQLESNRMEIINTNNCSTYVGTLRLQGNTLAVAIVLLGMFSLLLWATGLGCLLRYRHHRAVRAASVELSVCLLVASVLRVPLVFSLALDASKLNCNLRVVLTALSTELTFTAIALKVIIRKNQKITFGV